QVGAFARWAVDQPAEVLERDYDLDAFAARNLLDFLREQEAATRVIPSDRTIVVERFRDEIGDWRLCVLSPFGGRVHAAWGLALSARLRDEYGLESDAIWSDDGIIVQLPDPDGLAVRQQPALRLRRHVHVRGRHSQRRAACGGAVPRSRAPARAARPGGAARPHRPGCARAGRGRSPASQRAHPRRDARRAG